MRAGLGDQRDGVPVTHRIGKLVPLFSIHPYPGHVRMGDRGGRPIWIAQRAPVAYETEAVADAAGRIFAAQNRPSCRVQILRRRPT